MLERRAVSPSVHEICFRHIVTEFAPPREPDHHRWCAKQLGDLVERGFKDLPRELHQWLPRLASMEILEEDAMRRRERQEEDIVVARTTETPIDLGRIRDERTWVHREKPVLVPRDERTAALHHDPVESLALTALWIRKTNLAKNRFWLIGLAGEPIEHEGLHIRALDRREGDELITDVGGPDGPQPHQLRHHDEGRVLKPRRGQVSRNEADLMMTSEDIGEGEPLLCPPALHPIPEWGAGAQHLCCGILIDIKPFTRHAEPPISRTDSVSRLVSRSSERQNPARKQKPLSAIERF